ncbi:WD40 repeat-like protein [Clathrospora elynae]|uniref:WD40 repeat-like protein n=1 Tax=Clathrospora elynae TaxID=706981 RepID=A0A6A5SVM3_9PLEO|nr:WD40 repeat-like protein [Clathrospora elynae]
MEQEGRREDDGVEDEENDLKRDEILEGPIHENEAGDDGNEISQSSLLSSNSASASDSDVQDSSDDASSIGSQQSIRHISCIQEAQLSPDGTCIFTADFARTFSVYPIDNGILSETGTCTLATYASFSSANPIWTFALNPLFNVQDASSTTVLVSRRDSYITLHNALWGATRAYDTEELRPSSTQPIDISKPLASYKLVNNLTEAVIAPLSLTYSNDGAHFFAGKQDGIAIFDFEDTDSPIHTIATIPAKRNKLKGGGRGFKGWISALSLSPPSISHSDGLLAAGARTRHVGIYDPVGGGEVTHFSLPGTINGKKNRNENLKHIMGDGVSSLKWSPCGKYLYVAERHSDVLLIYDVRNFSLSLGYCAGRKALTKQKLGFDIWNAGASPYDIEGISHEIWAGSTDGKMRVWRDPYRKEGAVEPDEVVQVGEEEAPVVGTLVHPSGSLAVAACGSVVLDDEMKSQGMRRGGGLRPKFREWGSLDILGLG